MADNSSILLDVSETPRYQAELKSFLNNGTLPNLYERPHVMQYIQRLKTDAALRGDYEEAEHYTGINSKFYHACIEHESKLRSKQQVEDMEDRFHNTIMKYSDTRHEWDDKIDEARQHEEEKLQQLQEKHLKEIQAFNEKWSSELTLLKFAKPSNTLQDVLYKHKMSVLTRQYDMARTTQKHAEELEEEEANRASIIAQQTAQRKKTELLARQEEELRQATERARKRISNLKLRRDSEIKLANTHIQHAEQVRVRKSHPRWKTAEIMLQTRSATIDTAGVSTPRTHQKMLQYRKSQNIPILQLRPLKKGGKISKRPSTKMWASPQAY